MNADELAKMVVRLVGDASSFISMIGQAQISLKGLASQATEAVSKVLAVNSALKKMASVGLGVLSSFGVVGSLKGAFDKFIAMEQVTLGLTAAIKSHGGEVDDVMGKYDKFAKSISAVTGMTKIGTLRLLEQAETMGFTGDAAVQVATNAVALAKGNEEAAQSMIRVATMMQRGHPEFAKRILGLQGIKKNSELMVAIQKKLQTNFEIATARTKSLGGQIDKLHKSLIEFNIEIGKSVAEIVGPFVTTITQVIYWFKQLDPSIKKTVAQVLLCTMAFLAIAPAIATATFFFGPLISVLSALISTLIFLATSPITLVIAAIAGLVAAFLYFTDSGAALLKWFGDQWKSLVSDVTTSIKGIAAAIKAGDINLAWKIVWAQVKLTFARTTIDLQKMWIATVFGIAEAMVNAERFITSSWEEAINFVANKLIDLQVLLGMISEKEGLELKWIIDRDLEKDLKAIENARKALIAEIQKGGRAEFEDLDKELKNLEKERDRLVNQAKALPPLRLPEFKIPPLPKMKLDVKLVPKFDAAAFASAEAITRIQRWRETLDMQFKGGEGALAKGPTATGAEGAEANTRRDDQTTVLKEILKTLREGNAKAGLPVVPVGLG